MKRNTKRVLAAVGVLVIAALTLSACLVPLPIPMPSADSPGDHVPTPGTAGAGDARFTEQAVNWDDCGDDMKCADVLAPLDWADPGGETITLFLVKHEATGDERLGTLFMNPGGPGASGASYIEENIDYSVGEELQQSFDVVGWDPRGVGRSSAVHCYDDAGMDEYLFGDPREFADLARGSDEWIAEAREEAREYGEVCLENTGELLGYVDTMSTVKDLDLLREIVGDDKLNYLGFSYGTFIGATYAEAYPDRVGRLVLDGVLPPDVTMHDVVLEQTRGFEAAMRAYLTDCLTRAGCPFTSTVDSAMSDIGAMIDRVEKEPIQAADGRWISSGTLLTAIITPLYSQSSWTFLDRLFEPVTLPDPLVALFLADFYYDRGDDGSYADNSNAAFSAINCLDYPPGGDVKLMREQAAELVEAAPTFGKYQGFSDLSCAEWPFAGVSERGPVSAEGADPILVIGTTGDPATPYVWAESLAGQLESGVLVTYNGEGHTVYGGGITCIDEVVEDYFVRGSVPAADPNC